jgi:hypothetical protein
MAYIVKEISADDVKKIISDADERKKRHLLARGGYFFDLSDYFWAIDLERNMYLLLAPNLESRSIYSFFYFHFENVTYGFRAEISSSKPLQIDELPSRAKVEIFKAELLEAFEVYQSSGRTPKYSLSFS